MSYRIDKTLPVGVAVRNVAAEETRKALETVAARDRPVEGRIHQLRKHCKKVRALARLVRPGFVEFADTNTAFRDIARLVSEHRDARVMAKLVEHLAGADTSGGKVKQNPIVRWYRCRAELAEQVSAPVLAWVEHLLANAAIEIEGWQVNGIEIDDALEGFGAALQIVHERTDGIGDDSRADANHEWRKACKDHWYHLLLLEKVLPKRERHRLRQFDVIGELLGDAHDRSVLLRQLEELPGFLRNNVSVKRIAVVAHRERRALSRRAVELCQQALDPSPETLTDMIAERWLSTIAPVDPDKRLAVTLDANPPVQTGSH